MAAGFLGGVLIGVVLAILILGMWVSAKRH